VWPFSFLPLRYLISRKLDLNNCPKLICWLTATPITTRASSTDETQESAVIAM
jgi:hypothetical protein